jgi:Amidohydrolase
MDFSFIRECSVFDTHEHLQWQQDVINHANGGSIFAALMPRSYMGFFDFYPGLLQKKGDTLIQPPPLQPYSKISQYWKDYSENNFRIALEKGIKAIYDVDLSNNFNKSQIEQKIQELDEQILINYNLKGWGGKIFKKFQIQHLVNDGFDSDLGLSMKNSDCFSKINSSPRVECAFRMNSFLYAFADQCWQPITDYPHKAPLYYEIETNNTDKPSLSEFLEILDVLIDKISQDYVSIKLASAYERPLSFQSKSNIKSIEFLKKYWGQKLNTIPENIQHQLGDIILHEILSRISNLPIQKQPVIQIHTGMASKFPSNPALLIPIINDYPNLQFNLLHGGFPDIHETISLLEKYPNVVSELVWLPLLSKQKTIEMFKLLIEKNLWNRVAAFGGDCACIEGSIGALLTTQEYFMESINQLLENNTSLESITSSAVEEMYRMMFYDISMLRFKQ